MKSVQSNRFFLYYKQLRRDKSRTAFKSRGVSEVQELMDRDFGKEYCFRYFPIAENITYEGEPSPGMRRWRLGGKAGDHVLLTSEVFLREDREIRDSVRELFDFSIKTAEARLSGSFELEMIFAADPGAMRSFQPANLAQLIVNYGSRLENGRQCIMAYTGARLRLKKLAPLDWGKIRFSHGITVLPERGKLDLHIKKIWAQVEDVSGPASVMVRDFSSLPLFRFGEEPQTERLARFLEKSRACGKENRSILILRGREAADLCAQFGASGSG